MNLINIEERYDREGLDVLGGVLNPNHRRGSMGTLLLGVGLLAVWLVLIIASSSHS